MIDGFSHETGKSVNLLCQSLGVSRSGFYDYLKNKMVKKESENAIKNQIEQITLEYPRYGYRRVTMELKRRQFEINHKKVLRIMSESDLLCKSKRKFMTTTDSNHALPIYPNLIKGIVPTDINQVWVADITYIALTSGRFIFLAVVIDLYSRKVVGWDLREDLSKALVVHALEMAIVRRRPPQGLIHHSDRGVQYASYEYTDILKSNNFQISMSRKGNPYDNAVCESFNKTLKWDEVRLNEYDNYYEAKNHIANYIENIYNAKRLHSSLNYRPPDEFEEDLVKSQLVCT